LRSFRLLVSLGFVVYVMDLIKLIIFNNWAIN
jgi:hypothetical protein